MGENTKTELGEIRIHKNVIASIAIEAAKQIPGVVKIDGNLKTVFLDTLGQKNYTAIKIEFDKNNEATITIPLIVIYGYNIPEIASRVQNEVKTAIENTTNINVKEININIQKIQGSKDKNSNI